MMGGGDQALYARVNALHNFDEGVDHADHSFSELHSYTL